MSSVDSHINRTVVFAAIALVASLVAPAAGRVADKSRPHIIFVMADDMGWGQTGYYNHPVLKTPHLDAMAAAGLRFDRFYAGAPVCSPTRASVLTGRANDRTGVPSHGHALRLQEKTVAQALQQAGYVTGHFGKWHLNGLRGPGAPVLGSDPRSPAAFGFDEWVSVTNYFDVNPLMSRQGQFEEFQGDSSEVAVGEALKFIERHAGGEQPMFAIIWYGTPHSPFKALAADQAPFAELDDASKQHYGELRAMDRSIGTLRSRLRELNLADNTMLVFCSDNGGLPGITPETVGGLRGFKGSIFEGGLRVPGIIEWPAVITTPRATNYPASTMDLFPTVADVVGLPESALGQPIDGTSLKPLFTADVQQREKPIPFRYQQGLALVDNRYKLLTQNVRQGEFELYDLAADPRETQDISQQQPEVAARMKQQLLAFHESVEASVAGRDYPEGRVVPADPRPRFWAETTEYQPYLAEWGKRPEYQRVVRQIQDRPRRQQPNR